jgi:putative ABC transport system permease protein
VLLIGAALLIRTFIALRNVNPGFDAHNVLTLEMSLTGDRFLKTAGVAQLARDGRERLNAIPGVEQSRPPAACRSGRLRPALQHRRPRHRQSPWTGDTNWMSASPGYLRLQDSPSCAGATSLTRTPLAAPGVVIINESMAKKYWPKARPRRPADAHRQRRRPAVSEEPARQIIGVMADIHDGGLNNDPRELMIVPKAQVTDGMTALNAGIGPMPGSCAPTATRISTSLQLPSSSARPAAAFPSPTCAP